MNQICITAVYVFKDLDTSELPQLKERLNQFAEANDLKGLLVIGAEGINGTVSGSLETIMSYKALITDIAGCPVEFKDSKHSTHPFRRWVVDIRKEIVTSHWELEEMKQLSEGTHLSPTEWNEHLMNREDAYIIDTRNDYEVEVGTFKGAIDPKIRKFSDFSWYVDSANLDKDKPVYLFCTGGIRCEKAVPEMKRKGFQKVFQLEGGILKYIEEYPNQLYEGECFVFDHRVSVQQDLSPSVKYKLCPHCGNPGTEKISCVKCGTEKIVCRKCLDEAHLKTCSKNCAYHEKLAIARKNGEIQGRRNDISKLTRATS